MKMLMPDESVGGAAAGGGGGVSPGGGSSEGSGGAPSAPPTGPSGGGAPNATQDFGALDGGTDLDGLVEPGTVDAGAGAPPAEGVGAGQPGGQPPATTPTPVPAAAAQPPAPTGQQAPAQPAGAQAPEAQPPAPGQGQQAPVDVMEELVRNRDVVISGLAQEHFQLSPQEQEMLADNPAQVVSMVAARVYYQATVNFLTQMKALQATIPRMIHLYSSSQNANADAKKAFFTQFPDLAPHEAEVGKMLNVLQSRGLTKGMSKEQFWAEAARMTRAYVGLAGQVPASGQQPRPNGAVPFAPAPSGTPATQVQRVVEPWGGLGLDLE